MEGKVNGRKTLKTAPVSDFLSYLTNALPSDENAKAKSKKIRTIIRELPYVHFELNSKEFDDFEFLPTGIKNGDGGFHTTEDKSFAPLFEDSFHEILIMSPFLTNSVIKDFIDRNKYINHTDYMLFTRAMSLGKLNPTDCADFRIFTMKDADINVMSQIEKIENTVMSGLKDFQKATVTRIDQLYRAGQMRVLVSDEVGLGKTLIARGTIAKLAKMQKEAGDNLVKVVYICSNASIAEQNLNKLRITSELRTEHTGSSRLSMQHLNIFKQENDSDLLSRYIQLIPLTPDTSFRMTNGAGTYSERALMFAILRRLPELSPYTKALEFAMKDGASSGWDGWAKSWYETEVVECDKLSGGKYLSYMLDKLSVELRETVEENVTYLDLIIGMCKNIEKYGYKKQNNT